MMNDGNEAELFARLQPRDRKAFFSRLSSLEQQDFLYRWQFWARREQRPPEGDWSVWMIMAGRGFGKTRAGAEWVRNIAEGDGSARFALVGANYAETRTVMVEGESGLLSIAPPQQRPVWEPSLKRLTWDNGAQAHLYSAAEPEGLRGPQHSHGGGTSAQGTVPQRSPCANRLFASSGRSGDRNRSGSCRAPCRPVMACRSERHKRMARSGRQNCRLDGEWLAVHIAVTADANLCRIDRQFRSLSGYLAIFGSGRQSIGRGRC